MPTGGKAGRSELRAPVKEDCPQMERKHTKDGEGSQSGRHEGKTLYRDKSLFHYTRVESDFKVEYCSMEEDRLPHLLSSVYKSTGTTASAYSLMLCFVR